MDDRDLEARLSARLQQRFDRAEPSPGLSRDISDARMSARSSGRRSGFVSLLAAAAVLAVVAVALGASFSRPADIGGLATPSPESTEAPSPSPAVTPPSATVSPSPTVAPTSAVPGACAGGDLLAEVIRWEGAAGSRFGTIAMQNAGAQSCNVIGTPGFQLVDGQANVFLDSADYGYAPSFTPPDGFALGGGGSDDAAYLVIRLSNYCGAAPSPPLAVALILPYDLGRVLAMPAAGVTIDVAPCNGPSAAPLFEIQQRWSTTAP